jgi:phosphoribosylformimino-5-aminoimidazole carboxamide ribotide isomerase
MDRETFYSDDPAAMARRWESEGAKMLHIVDLDGAVGGSPANEEAVRAILKTLSIPCELGGGIRTMEIIERYLGMGLDKVVLGTVAIKNPDLVRSAAKAFPGRIVVGIDALGGKVAVKGWTETTGESALDLARRFEGMGIAAINYTDISRDGAMAGPNIEATAEMVRSVKIPVIAAGGVSRLEDIINLAKTGVAGTITGKALYEGAFSLKEAIKLLA